MSAYDEFHVVVSPSPQPGAGWDVLLRECPLPVLSGTKATVQPVLTWDDLVKLRSRHDWPDPIALEGIGQRVWDSFMEGLKPAFEACLAFSQQLGHGMRLIVSIVGEDAEDQPTGVRLQELPVEALLHSAHAFVAMNPATPVSRGVRPTPDRDPANIARPLRILVVIATPVDLSKDANAQAEKDAIQEALKPLINVGSVELEFCDPPTRTELASQLQKKHHHVLHFITHGGFDLIGADPSPLPCLMLERSATDHNNQPLDANTLDGILLASSVRLVVMTACSSAAPTPDERPYRTRALSGVAQQVVESPSSVSAAVGMQFDLESNAAVTFSRCFYENLLAPGLALDEIVSLCRQQLVSGLNAGHRAWITPAVFSRCKGGRVFEFGSQGPVLSEAARQKLGLIDWYLGAQRTQIERLRISGQATPAVLGSILPHSHAKVEELRADLALAVGEHLAVNGGTTALGQIAPCRLSLRLQAPAQIGNVRAEVRFPEDQVSFTNVTPGSHAPGVFSQVTGGGKVELMLPDVSAGAVWPPGDYDLACLNFQVLPGAREPIIELHVEGAKAQKNGLNDVPLAGLKGMLFVI